MTGKLEYSSNNSGGSWWLKDADWFALEEAGWTVDWFKDQDGEGRIFKPDANGRMLGALAKSASKETDNPDEAVAEFERITGQNADDEGCNCCGEPHYFSYTDAKGKRVTLDSKVVARRRSWS
jgi:hypothetical protein